MGHIASALESRDSGAGTEGLKASLQTGFTFSKGPTAFPSNAIPQCHVFGDKAFKHMSLLERLPIQTVVPAMQKKRGPVTVGFPACADKRHCFFT